MLRFLALFFIVGVALAWDPSLKIAEKIAIPHHIRHGYDYPYINMQQIMSQVSQNVRQGFSQPAPLEGSRPLILRQQPQQQPSAFEQNRGFQSQPFRQNTGFQSQPLEQNRDFRSSPVRQTRFFERLNQNSRPEFGSGRSSNSFFNRRLS